MIGKNCFWAMLGVCGSLLVASGSAAQTAEPAAQHASAWDARVVCRRVKDHDSRTRKKECATREEWRARADMKVVCLWGTLAGAETRQQFCNTVAQWRALGISAAARTNPNGRAAVSGGANVATGTSPSVPGNTNFGTAASQSSFQR